MSLLLEDLLRDEGGQDLIEYALLAAFVGLVGIAAFSRIETAIATAYTTFTTNENDNWQMPDPGGSS
jgi:pilus assembly protein Flp/PilA